VAGGKSRKGLPLGAKAQSISFASIQLCGGGWKRQYFLLFPYRKLRLQTVAMSAAFGVPFQMFNSGLKPVIRE
jgi:hypothetical protein